MRRVRRGFRLRFPTSGRKHRIHRTGTARHGRYAVITLYTAHVFVRMSFRSTIGYHGTAPHSTGAHTILPSHDGTGTRDRPQAQPQAHMFTYRIVLYGVE